MPRVRRDFDTPREKPALSWKVALYIRLSKEDGNDESYSVTNQKQRLHTHLETLCLEEKMTLYDVYVDDGYTGTDSDRDDFQRMLADIERKAVNCVIVKDLSRLSRNDWECKRYLQHLFVMKNVRFISLELPALDSFKRPDEVYDMGVSIQSMYNENHCRETSIKVRGTFNAKRKAGEFIGAFTPYGYLKDPEDRHRFVIDEDAASVIRDIFQWFVYGGMSKNGIVKKLTGLNVPSPAAYKIQNGMNYHSPNVRDDNPLWSSQSVHTILTNQMYLGHMVQGRQKVKSYKVHTRVSIPKEEWFIVKDTHAPIIDQETFDKAQELMRRDTRTAPKAATLYPFSGFLRCADCGRAMGRRVTGPNVYYACTTKLTKGLCTRHTIRHDKLESAVLTAIQSQIALVEQMAELIEEAGCEPARQVDSKRLTAALKAKKAEREKVSGLKAGLYVDWKSGDITREEYHAMKKDFEERERRLGQGIAELEEEGRDILKGITPENPCFEAFLKHKNVQGLDRRVIVELIKVIRVHEGGDLTIDFNFADQYKRIVELIENSGKEITTAEGVKVG